MPSRNSIDWNAPPKLPATHYTRGDIYRDEAIFEDEQERIFKKVWRLACHESEVASPGDFRTLEYAGTPLVVVRGQDGVIRTFVNVCSHRGARIVHQPAGNMRHMVCFFHLWTYDLTGSCTSIPRPEAYEKQNLNKDKLGLREVRTGRKCGLVFVNLDDACESLDDYIGDALEAFENVLTENDLEVFTYQHATIDANWKEWQETNLDLYHEYMHVALRKTQIDPKAMNQRELKVYPKGHIRGGGSGYSANYDGYSGWAKREDSKALRGLTASDFRFTHIFPCSSMNARGTIMRISTFTPLNAHQTRIEWRGMSPRSDSEDDWAMRTEHYNQYWGPFGRNVPEDLMAAELCEWNFGPAAARYQIIAREEGMRGQDDGFLRAFYQRWGELMGRSASGEGDTP
ncbi:MAG: aromatic ring-hydroxylating dioxygenase subunit alpha [Proteobacteria bacterium]|nr:aromatic ring-hydroxylating dioxygenase subunit alpha [Pseudomonadota bacterium]MDA1059719.1 aromatic ring-hydroxylating dioxygenase subunit alpha [Pseudomonadota bacterium]